MYEKSINLALSLKEKAVPKIKVMTDLQVNYKQLAVVVVLVYTSNMSKKINKC